MVAVFTAGRSTRPHVALVGGGAGITPIRALMKLSQSIRSKDSASLIGQSGLLKSDMKRFQSFLLVTGLLLSSQVVLAESSFAAKINRTPSTLSALSAGSSRTFTFTLDAPIICAGGSPTCAVTLSFSNSNSSVATLDSSSITWASTDWTQSRSITLSVTSNLAYSDSASVLLASSAVSNSAYYSNFSISINQPLTLPPSPAQIAAAEAEAAIAAAAEAARLREIEIANFRATLIAKLVKGERPKLIDYNNAVLNQVTFRTVELVTDRIFLMNASKGLDFGTIVAIANEVAFYDEFFNPLYRPTVFTYVMYGYIGVTERTLKAVNAKVLDIPGAKRADVQSIQEIANEEAFVDRVANTQTRSSVTSTALITKGLLPANTVYKHSVVQGLASYPEASLNSIAKIEAAIKAEIEKAGARKAKTEEIKAKIAARRK